jgi:hypothetical protein
MISPQEPKELGPSRESAISMGFCWKQARATIRAVTVRASGLAVTESSGIGSRADRISDREKGARP